MQLLSNQSAITPEWSANLPLLDYGRIARDPGRISRGVVPSSANLSPGGLGGHPLEALVPTRPLVLAPGLVPGGRRFVRNQACRRRGLRRDCKPTYRVNSNAAIIFVGDSVLVVDANSTPSAARALIEQIKKLTPRPVKYVVNTHFHWDHTQGNEAYTNAWPAGVEIISSEATRANMERLGIPRWKHELAAMPQEIEQLKSDLQKATSADQKDSIRKNL